MSRSIEHLRLLADATRLRILHLLQTEPLTVAELQEILDLSQSSVSGHLAKLKRSGYIHVLPEGSAHRYRLRDDLGTVPAACWERVRELTADDPDRTADERRLQSLRAKRNRTWVDRVAGSLHREYLPGRTAETLMHGLLQLADLGRCLDVGAGDGALIELLAPRTEELVCLEPSDAMVAAGRRRITELRIGNATYEQGVAEELPFADDSFATLLFLQSLQYTERPGEALAEAIRVLAPGGRLLVLTLLAHHHAEAGQYGHVHRGFRRAQLNDWTRTLARRDCYRLPPENRPPRFVPLVFIGVK